MPFEHESLVGYLYMVGGRAISQPPPGALVELAPRRAARGREADTVYLLITPSGETSAPAKFYDELARDAAAAYFEGTGSVTAGIRAVFNAANDRLIDDLDRARRAGIALPPPEAAMLCAVLRGSDLFVGKTGGGVVLLHQNALTQTFPADISDDDQVFSPPLGALPIPDVRMTRYTVSPGARLLFSDPSLTELPIDTLRAALGEGDIGAALAHLRERLRHNVMLMLIELIPPMTPSPVPARVGESSAAIGGRETPAPAAQPAQSSPAAETPPEPVVIPRARRDEALRGAASSVADRTAGVVRTIQTIFERIVPAPPEGERGWLASPAAIGVAVLLPVALVVAVVVLWVSGTGASEFDQCVGRVQTAASTARLIAPADVRGTVAAWNAVLVVVSECEAMRSQPDAALTAIRREGRSILDRLQNITRRALVPIYAFPNAQLTQIVLQGDDVYVLDSNNQQVYRITLAANGLAAIAGSYEPIPAMRRGGRVINFDIGDLIDIAWAENGAGLAASNVITALDRSGLLIACPPRFLQDCTAQRLPGAETWRAPVAMQYWEGRLYVLDPAGNQIWRYDPTGGTFASVPIEYFAGGTRPDITSAVDFAITSAGDIYLLLNTGVVARFRGGQQQPFAFTFPPAQSMTNPRAMFLNPNPVAQGLFFVEQGQRTLFETTMAGTFINAWRAEDEALFAGLNHVAVDSGNGVIYTVSGNTLFAFRREG